MPQVFNFMNGIGNFLIAHIRAMDEGYGAFESIQRLVAIAVVLNFFCRSRLRPAIPGGMP
jgi:uncharacterized membrane protein